MKTPMQRKGPDFGEIVMADLFWKRFGKGRVTRFCMDREGMVYNEQRFFEEYKAMGLSRSSPSRVKALYKFLRSHGKIY